MAHLGQSAGVNSDVNLNLFDAYEVHPCREVDAEHPERHYEQCEETDTDIAIWTVYGHIRRGGIDWISDHDSKAAAEEAMAKLPPVLVIAPGYWHYRRTPKTGPISIVEVFADIHGKMLVSDFQAWSRPVADDDGQFLCPVQFDPIDLMTQKQVTEIFYSQLNIMDDDDYVLAPAQKLASSRLILKSHVAEGHLKWVDGNLITDNWEF